MAIDYGHAKARIGRSTLANAQKQDTMSFDSLFQMYDVALVLTFAVMSKEQTTDQG